MKSFKFVVISISMLFLCLQLSGQLWIISEVNASTRIDEIPVVEVNNTVQLFEGATVVISEDDLRSSDTESTASEIIYTFDPEGENIWPKSGLFFLDAIPLGSASTFTQSDINNGLLSYQHDGTENVTDGFVFSLKDASGQFAETDQGSTLFFFEISVNLLNDDPVFFRNNPTQMIEWEIATIDSAHLAAIDEESGNDEIVFTLVPELILPMFGHLEVHGNAIQPGDSFTMQDIIDGALKYIQVRNATEAFDNFVFQVRDPDGGLMRDGDYTDFKHQIDITLTAENLEKGSGISVFPNPGKGVFNIKYTDEISGLEIFNLLGERVKYIASSGRSQCQLNLEGQSKGIYLLVLQTSSGNLLTKKLVIE